MRSGNGARQCGGEVEVFLVEVGGVGRRARVVEWVGMSFSEGQQAMPVES